uniref:NADH dehydrogenase subunit 6 n=1 Tax=Knipowitschia caucasica TaxID=637954 RepID=A0AAV2M4A4_KNICA
MWGGFCLVVGVDGEVGGGSFVWGVGRVVYGELRVDCVFGGLSFFGGVVVFLGWGVLWVCGGGRMVVVGV